MRESRRARVFNDAFMSTRIKSVNYSRLFLKDAVFCTLKSASGFKDRRHPHHKPFVGLRFANPTYDYDNAWTLVLFRIWMGDAQCNGAKDWKGNAQGNGAKDWDFSCCLPLS